MENFFRESYRFFASKVLRDDAQKLLKLRFISLQAETKEGTGTPFGLTRVIVVVA